jgi:hypothetical protein
MEKSIKKSERKGRAFAQEKAKIQAQALKHLKSKKSEFLHLVTFFEGYIKVLKTEKIQKEDIVCDLKPGKLEDTSHHANAGYLTSQNSGGPTSESIRAL